MRRLLFVVPVVLAALGCERPLIDFEPAAVTGTTPDLGVVQTHDLVPLQIHVSDGDGVARVTVNGEPASRSPDPDVFLDTLRLNIGLNPLAVVIEDARDNVTADTLYAVYLPYGASAAPPLPEARYEHTATALEDGRLLVAGGFVDGQAAPFVPTRPRAP